MIPRNQSVGLSETRSPECMSLFIYLGQAYGAGVGWTPPLNEFIRHYEPAPYDRDALATHHRRLRRDVSSPPPPTPLRLHFAAHNSRAGKLRHTRARARAERKLGRLSFVLDFSDIGLLLLHDPSLPYVERIQAPSDSFLVDNIEMSWLLRATCNNMDDKEKNVCCLFATETEGNTNKRSHTSFLQEALSDLGHDQFRKVVTLYYVRHVTPYFPLHAINTSREW
uniref:Uncharacterized protein n=1 Tax=Timema genevievae TaxID=629358 RepID=A0A7R9JTX4_TIMGE|nr:unnamed protein product [Timema genevievae]